MSLTSDIMERLQNEAKGDRQYDVRDDSVRVSCELLRDAAREIRRLRVALYEIMEEPLDDEAHGFAKQMARDALQVVS